MAEAACAETDTLHNMPFEVTPEKVYAAIMAADAYGRVFQRPVKGFLLVLRRRHSQPADESLMKMGSDRRRGQSGGGFRYRMTLKGAAHSSFQSWYPISGRRELVQLFYEAG